MSSASPFIENIALRWLKSRGLRVVANNYQSSAGNVDIIMLERNTLCFIQVRNERHLDVNNPSVEIAAEDKQAMFHAAESFINHQHRYSKYTRRFDALVITPGADEPYEFNWIKQAF